MGPMPLAAIKRGEVTLPYDGKFVFAEVNGDRVTWMHDENDDVRVLRISKYTCVFIACDHISFNIYPLFFLNLIVKIL